MGLRVCNATRWVSPFRDTADPFHPELRGKEKSPSPLLQANPTTLPASAQCQAAPGGHRAARGRHGIWHGGTTLALLLLFPRRQLLLPAQLWVRCRPRRTRRRAVVTVVQPGQGKRTFPRAGMTQLTSPHARCRESGSRNGRVGSARGCRAFAGPRRDAGEGEGGCGLQGWAGTEKPQARALHATEQ